MIPLLKVVLNILNRNNNSNTRTLIKKDKLWHYDRESTLCVTHHVMQIKANLWISLSRRIMLLLETNGFMQFKESF